MPKIEITRTERVWPGKYDEEGNLVKVIDIFGIDTSQLFAVEVT